MIQAAGSHMRELRAQSCCLGEWGLGGDTAMPGHLKINICWHLPCQITLEQWLGAHLSPTLPCCTDPNRAGTQGSAKGCVKPELGHHVNLLCKQATSSVALQKWSNPEAPPLCLGLFDDWLLTPISLRPSGTHHWLSSGLWEELQRDLASPKRHLQVAWGITPEKNQTCPEGQRPQQEPASSENNEGETAVHLIESPLWTFQTSDNTSKEPKQGKPQTLPSLDGYSAVIQVCQPAAVPS